MTCFLSVSELTRALTAGELTAETVVGDALAQAEKSKSLNAWLCLNDKALDEARAVDAARGRGEALGPLAGIPVLVKDAICTRGMPTTAASKILTRDGHSYATGWVPDYDATVIERLRRAGAVLLGKANMDEFAMGSSTENSAFGDAKNPWAPDRTPGGSSGGSAAAVAAGMAPLSLGSDTGGSIRQPAALSGVVGVKPSYGRVSRYGLIAFGSSLDQIGPFSRDVQGAALALEVIAGACDRDSTCSPAPIGAYAAACKKDVAGLRIGIPEEYFGDGLSDEVRAGVEAVIDALKSQGATTKAVRMPHTHYGVSTYYLLATAEASSNLSRFDGVRYGLREELRGDGLAELYARSREAGFGPEVKRRIMLGTYALSSGYYDAYYKKAQKVRTLIREDFDAAFAEVDALITPSTPTVAFKLGEKSDPLQMYLADVYTLPASLAGIAGISLPAGFSTPQDGAPALPIGVQILTPAFAEERMFQLAAAWERQNPTAHATPAF